MRVLSPRRVRIGWNRRVACRWWWRSVPSSKLRAREHPRSTILSIHLHTPLSPKSDLSPGVARVSDAHTARRRRTAVQRRVAITACRAHTPTRHTHHNHHHHPPLPSLHLLFHTPQIIIHTRALPRTRSHLVSTLPSHRHTSTQHTSSTTSTIHTHTTHVHHHPHHHRMIAHTHNPAQHNNNDTQNTTLQ